LEDHRGVEYHQSEEELMDLIEMVPFVVDFDRKKDEEKV